MPRFDVAVFCYPPHQSHLAPLLDSIEQHISGYDAIRIVWDDCNQPAGDCSTYEVVPHSSWPWTDRLWAHGWIRQQILKLQCYHFSDADYTWVVDADTLVCKSFDLFDPSGRPYLRYQNQAINSDLGCYDFMQQYFGIKSVHPTIIANGGGNCVFDHAVLKLMHEYCVAHNGGDLADVLHGLMVPYTDQDLNQWRGYPFSEFETYGNWVHQNCADRAVPAEPNWSLVDNSQDIRVY